mgnify:FL=1
MDDFLYQLSRIIDFQVVDINEGSMFEITFFSHICFHISVITLDSYHFSVGIDVFDYGATFVIKGGTVKKPVTEKIS